MLFDIQNIKMVISDLDGTLLNSDNKVSESDYAMLKQLGDSHIIRVLATGRSIFSANKVLETDFPADFLIFSNGAGVMDWKTKQLILNYQLPAVKVEKIAKLLIQHKVDFMIQHLIPLNHHYFYHYSGGENPDFFSRNRIYQKYISELNPKGEYEPASQFIAIIPDGFERFTFVKNLVSNNVENISIIRATSPIDGKSIWLEIFPNEVSKGKTVKWLCNQLEISLQNTIGIGNDYNDLPLLEVTKYSYVVDNAPDELKKLFFVTQNNNNSGFSHIFKNVIR